MGGYCRVLIVDDEFITRQGMKHMIEWEKEGFQIVGEASNGQEGLNLIEELKPHIVLADIVMPLIDGIEFSEILGKRHPSIQLIILSSYDKFEYVKTTLLNGASDYILKPTLNPEILLKALRRAAARIPGLELQTQSKIPYESQLEKLLLGYQDRLDEVTFVDVFSHTLFRLLAVDLRLGCGRKRSDMIAAREMLDDYCSEQKDYVTIAAFINEDTYCIVINYRVKDEAMIVSDAQKLAARLGRLYPRIFFVMSRTFSTMHDIRSYFQQDIALKIRGGFYYPLRHLFIVEEYKPAPQVNRFEFESYTHMLSSGQLNEALGLFERYLHYICEMQIEEDKLKNLTKNLLYNFLIEYENYSSESADLKEQYFEQIDMAYWVDDYDSVMKEIFEVLRSQIQSAGGTKDARIIEIQAYVRAHYSEPLNLSDIAKHLGYNYNYISSYFSSNSNEGFSEYLNRVRIAEACRMLKEKKGTIAEIGRAVGYSDQSYFSRVFKRLTGETPSGYRRKERRNHEA